MALSAVIIAKNEEKNIEACLKSLSFCDEKIVIDDNSTDKTSILAKKMGAQVFAKEKEGNFSNLRNFGLSKAEGDWILFVDADERVSDALSLEITYVINDSANSLDGYLIKRKDTIWGKELKHGDSGAIRLLRLGKKGKGEWKGQVHEIWNIKGKTEILKNQIFHYPHRGVEDFLRSINYYTDLRAEELIRKKVKITWFSIIAYPFSKFFISYFIKLGFLDGVPGFISATMMSLHSFLSRGKAWQLNNQSRSKIRNA